MSCQVPVKGIPPVPYTGMKPDLPHPLQTPLPNRRPPWRQRPCISTLLHTAMTPVGCALPDLPRNMTLAWFAGQLSWSEETPSAYPQLVSTLVEPLLHQRYLTNINASSCLIASKAEAPPFTLSRH
jgi:hypothetical protein